MSEHSWVRKLELAQQGTLTDVEHHDANDEEIDEQSTRALSTRSARRIPGTRTMAKRYDQGPRGRKTYTRAQSRARTDEETGADGTTDGDHVEMARLHGTLELDETPAIVGLLEGLGVEAIAGHEALLAMSARRLLGDDLAGSLIGEAIAALLAAQGTGVEGFVLGGHGGLLAGKWASRCSLRRTVLRGRGRKRRGIEEEEEEEEKRNER